jgi:Tol biopolymer transport system component
MTFAPGSRLGPYQIVEKIGAGGMGEVFRARDTRLDREVAIKVLPEAFAQDADRVARFEREAKAIAALSHPNVLTIFDTGRHDAPSTQTVLYVVTELLEGETLRDRLAHGALPVRKAIDYAVRIARGLAAAHDKGLVHRDLKPENVFLLADGQVKILDFGLARVAATSGSGATQTVAAITDPGTVMGTVGYMAPEQIRGQPVDARCDVFAFGAVLYEMLGGTRAFARETAAETMTAILKEEPADLTESHPDISPALDRIIRHCLEKNAAERFQSARDAAFALESLSASGATTMTSATRSGQSTRPLTIAAAVAAIAAVIWLAWNLGAARSGDHAAQVVRLDVALPPGRLFPEMKDMTSLAFAPDGRTLYYVGALNGTRQVFQRRLDSIESEAVAGTEGATQVFAFPDGEWLAFTTIPPALRRLPVAGGPSAVIANAASAILGMAVASEGDVIYGTHSHALFRIAAGGKPVSVVQTGDLGPPRYPVVLPDSKGLLFTVGGVPASNRIAVLPAGETTPKVLTAGTDAVWVSTGHLVFWRDGGLWAAPFDVARTALTGEPVPVVQDVAVRGTGRAGYAVAPNGTLAYVKAGRSPERTLVWVDRQGHETPLKARPGPYAVARLSPDDSRVILSYRTDATEDLWMHDIARGVTEAFVAEPVSEWSADWVADGERVLFTSRRDGPFRLYYKRANGLGDIEPAGEDVGGASIGGRTPDGSGILLARPHGPGVLTVSTGTVTTLWTEPQVEGLRISPDGRWIAYTTSQAGVQQLWVRPYPDVASDRWRVSADGGSSPRWSSDGKTLYYRNGTSMMAVSLRPGRTFSYADPVELFTGPYVDFDLARDGRFLMIKEPAAPPPAENRIVVVLNWFTELKARLARR